jgi:hypothetical protein
MQNMQRKRMIENHKFFNTRREIGKNFQDQEHDGDSEYRTDHWSIREGEIQKQQKDTFSVPI